MEEKKKYKTHTSTAVKNRYNAKTYKQVNISMKKSGLPILEKHLIKIGLPMSTYIKNLIKKDIGEDIDL